MTVNKAKYPPCFGNLETVFPMQDDGLRKTPEPCMICYCKTQCLKKAMTRKEGLKVREESVDRAYDSKMIGFFERWSRKKQLHQKGKEKKS